MMASGSTQRPRLFLTCHHISVHSISTLTVVPPLHLRRPDASFISTVYRWQPLPTRKHHHAFEVSLSALSVQPIAVITEEISREGY
jgi:hypothetical protein